MIKNINKNSDIPKKISICEKCGNTCEEVESNFILYGFKLCRSCKLAETIFTIF